MEMSLILGVPTEVRDIIPIAVCCQHGVPADHIVSIGQYVWQIPGSEVVIPLGHKMKKRSLGGDKPRQSFFAYLSPFALIQFRRIPPILHHPNNGVNQELPD